MLAPPFSAMVTARGRLYYIADESLPGIADMPDRWKLIARDAFNGTLLWKKPIKEWGMKYWMVSGFSGEGSVWRTQNPNQVMRRLVADRDRIFVTLGLFAPVTMLDGATGKVLKTFKGTENAFEILHEKGILYLAVNSGLKKEKEDPDISIMAVDISGSGKILWQKKGYRGIGITENLGPQYMDVYLTLGKEGLFFINKKDIVALDRRTGKKRWSFQYAAGSDPEKSKRKKNKGTGKSGTLTYYDSRLFFTQDTGKQSTPLLALDAGSGKKLWEKQGGSITCHTPPDLFVNHGLVWALNTDEWTYEGLDPLTGKKKKALDVTLISKGTHHNCYRNKATRDFFMYGRVKGVEFFDIDKNRSKRINWAKGGCRYGILPANGMIYFPSHFCACYATSKLNGIVAIGSTGILAAKPSTSDQVFKGPAFGKKLSRKIKEGNWPTYRQNMARTGFQPTPVSDKMKIKWSSRIKGNLTPPVAADQKVFLASKDDHRVICLDAKNGKTKWVFPAEGRVDSPPSFYKGRLVFGGRDGSVYCLDASTGQLAWRFRAAPDEKQMGAFGQIESVWPLFGTLLVHDDRVYCIAGRHANVNRGFFLYQLDIKTGYPRIGVHHLADISTEGEVDTTVNADILVGDGKIMHMRGMVFDMKTLKMIDIGKRFIERARPSPGHKMEIELITALGGFLEDSFFNGSQWLFNNRTANILSLDKKNLYGVNVYSKNSLKSSGHVNFHPGKEGIKLFAVGLKKMTSEEKTSKRKKDKRRGSKKNKGGPSLWSSTIPIKAKSLMVGPENLYLAGVRDQVDKKDPWAHFDGRKGGLLMIYSKKDGKLKREIELKSPPVFDGLASADKKLFVSCKDGSVICFE